ncbi:hypothetical protein GCM10010911_20620 [Paenibacillus nasutitermitis]|uniref:Uncharacterized protein n=1 Tax=Paenibacillus nasutitermitis TaxID=1652958 RepID=A0A916YVG0_9BACL|nr:hypothetical protein GCM10010911_20620 [Paenibacillus nasutitermitis]
MYAKNVMDSFYYLFIFIRSEPLNPVLYQILYKYKSWLHKDLKINYRSVNTLIKELNLVDDHQCKTRIISNLKKISVFDRARNIERIYLSILPIQYIIQSLINVIDQKETEKIRIMASSVHNYPSFILGKYYCNSIDFWNEHINYYNRTFQSDFMYDWKHLFLEYYPKNEN